jgi:hypothetical protein
MGIRLLSLVYDEHNVVVVNKDILVEFKTRFGGMINEDCPVVISVGP